MQMKPQFDEESGLEFSGQTKKFSSLNKIIQLTYEQSVSGIVIFSQNGRIMYCNQSFLSMVNLTSECGCIGHNFQDIIRADNNMNHILKYLKEDGCWTGIIKLKDDFEKINKVFCSSNILYTEDSDFSVCCYASFTRFLN